MIILLALWSERVRTALERRRASAALHDLSDRQLADLGIVRGMIDDHVRDGLPWPSPEEPGRPYGAPGAAALQGCG